MEDNNRARKADLKPGTYEVEIVDQFYVERVGSQFDAFKSNKYAIAMQAEDFSYTHYYDFGMRPARVEMGESPDNFGKGLKTGTISFWENQMRNLGISEPAALRVPDGEDDLGRPAWPKPLVGLKCKMTVDRDGKYVNVYLSK